MRGFNTRSATIKVIASAVEDFFNVNLGDYYRTFQEIRFSQENPDAIPGPAKGKLFPG
ncbi:MAG TPA: RteC domain-containing protein [Cyclobacteriaceae bacterium]|nr:RteC domain-containing protein [Cyclobacteriaceae bacterium]